MIGADTFGGANGIYKSTNGGANWVKVSSLAMDAVMQPQARYTFSDFSTDLDGWTAVGSGTLSYSATGGNPSGFASWADTAGTDGDGWLVAPPEIPRRLV